MIPRRQGPPRLLGLAAAALLAASSFGAATYRHSGQPPRSALRPSPPAPLIAPPAPTVPAATSPPARLTSAGPTPCQPSATGAGAAVPVRLRIGAISVDAPVIPVGLEPDGTLQVPPLDGRGAQETGWYDLGAAPGQAGPAVIVGHVDSTKARAVFYRLASLRSGDRVEVQLADCRTVGFRVSYVRRYAKQGFPTSEVYGPVPDAELRLITCGGSFDRRSRHYLDNVVAYATLAG